ncbi:hypothetical protein CK203_011305 [Vitis vinifera]|uniref:Uncharacterized protein n=1 Tax=Vitis vinifera TaxID=29760 RepID=A0A438JZ35_VITVI|nr:hypothetical protein CK203_011305 [Vitis vinifera]
MANTRRRRNILDKLRVNGVLLVGEDNIKDGVANAFFQMILSEVGKWRPSIDGLVFNSLLFASSTALEFYFSEEEVFAALSSLCGDKALGSDGFTLAFWQGCWEVVKSEVMGFFGEFYEPGSFERSLNATFLVLVPKKGKRVGGAEHLKNFRPISLMVYLYSTFLHLGKWHSFRAKDGGFIEGFLVKGMMWEWRSPIYSRSPNLTSNNSTAVGFDERMLLHSEPLSKTALFFKAIFPIPKPHHSLACTLDPNL